MLFTVIILLLSSISSLPRPSSLINDVNIFVFVYFEKPLGRTAAVPLTRSPGKLMGLEVLRSIEKKEMFYLFHPVNA